MMVNVKTLMLWGAMLTAALLGPPGLQRAALAEDPSTDFASKVPKFTFGRTLQQQETQLKTNPLLERFATSRRRMADDRYRPIYHYINPEGRLNDPNGLSFWNGRWHLFYQAYPPEDPRQHWGHAVSDDLVHWRDLPYAIYPDPEFKCFSGSALVEPNRVIAMYHGVKAGTMVAVSDDPLLLNWTKLTGGPVIPYPKPGEEPPPYNIFDPCVWKQGDYYYALTAGRLPRGPGDKPVRAEFLHRSRDLKTWEYLHPFLEDDHYSLIGDDGACPYFWPIGDEHILLHFSHKSGGKFLLGDYDTQRQKFVVTDGGDFNFGTVKPGGVHAPSAAPDGKGGIIVIFNMNEARPTPPWNRIMTLPRRLTLARHRWTNPLNIEPAGDIESLRRDHRRIESLKLPANQEVVLEKVRGNAMELIAEIAPQANQTVELNVLRSPGGAEATRIRFFRSSYPCTISIDTTRSSLASDVRIRPPETAHVRLGKREPLKLRVFIDRSVVEVFVNGRQCLATRVYPDRHDSVGVSLYAHGRDGLLTSLDAWQMQDIYGLGRGGAEADDGPQCTGSAQTGNNP